MHHQDIGLKQTTRQTGTGLIRPLPKEQQEHLLLPKLARHRARAYQIIALQVYLIDALRLTESTPCGLEWGAGLLPYSAPGNEA